MTAFARVMQKSGAQPVGNTLGQPTLFRNLLSPAERFRSLEPVLRERFRKKLARGKVECALRFTANDAAVTKLSLNEELAKQVSRR